jgi:hypothetical protein
LLASVIGEVAELHRRFIAYCCHWNERLGTELG